MEPNLPKENDPVIQEYRRFVYNLECTKEEELKVRLDHAITGMATEAGELLDLIKKVKFYKKETPRIQFLDELADELHYLVMAMNILGVTFEDLIRLNELKLKARYPKGYSNENAINRDREKEQEEMDKSGNDLNETV